MVEEQLLLYFLAADGQIYMNFVESWNIYSGRNYHIKINPTYEFMMSYSRGFKSEISKLFARQLGWKRLWWDHQNIGIGVVLPYTLKTINYVQCRQKTES